MGGSSSYRCPWDIPSIIYFIYHSNNAILFINYIGIYIVNTTNMRAKGEEKKKGGEMEGRWRGERERGDGGERGGGREEGKEKEGRAWQQMPAHQLNPPN